MLFFVVKGAFIGGVISRHLGGHEGHFPPKMEKSSVSFFEGSSMVTTTESVRAEKSVNKIRQSGSEAKERLILASLQERIGPQKFNAWFKHGIRIELENGFVKVAVPNSFVANWIESHYQSDIIIAANEHSGHSKNAVVVVDPSLSGEILKRQLDCQADIVTKTTQGRIRPLHVANHLPLRHKLKDFVVGDSNKLAYSAATAIAGGGQTPFSPLFIHGSCGVGKTHLLQGICNTASKVRKEGRPLAWKYVTGEQFTNEFILSLRQKKLPEFRERYRKLDLLAIDDVHFLAAKRATQDEFLHTFNAIDSAGKQIILASDNHPRLVGDLNTQLASRFVAGMVVKVEQPDRTTRLEILQRRAKIMKLKAPQEVLEYVAMHVHGSVRELEGSLVKLAALSVLSKGKVSIELATEALADHLARTDSAITLGDIESGVATYFGITPADIHSSRRTKTVSAARMISMFLARRHTTMSYPEIGRFMGKNHSSVVLAVQRMEALLAKNEEISWMTPMGVKAMPAKKLNKLLSEQFS